MSIHRLVIAELPGASNAGLRAEIRRVLAQPDSWTSRAGAVRLIARRVALTASGTAALSKIADACAENETVGGSS